MRPRRILHADWGIEPRKRWSAEAVLVDGAYHAKAAQLTTPDAVLAALEAGGTLAGFDFPIGVPRIYADRVRAAGHHFGSFLSWLTLLGEPPWDLFFDVAAARTEICVARPFYPVRCVKKGDALPEHLITALGVQSYAQLLRACETATGRQACSLFWTLGGNQVGRGALSGWRSVLQPALREKWIRVWPFDGDLTTLVRGEVSVVVETYPADSYSYVGAGLPETKKKGVAKKKGDLPTKGKRSPASRQASAQTMIAWATKEKVTLEPALQAQIMDGFGPNEDGEDPFDAVAGLFGMLSVVNGSRADGLPTDAQVRQVEGWMLGRQG